MPARPPHERYPYAPEPPAENRHPRHADSGREHDNQRQLVNQRKSEKHRLNMLPSSGNAENVAKEGR